MIHDKAFWKAIIANEFRLPIGYSADDLAPELIGYLGLPDPELRDEIAVEILTSWIVGGAFSPEALRGFMGQWTANLTQGIGEQGTNRVLLRSFSVLLLSIIAYYDWKNPFLSEAEIASLLGSALNYCAAEKDVRGYDLDMGWLHSPAHTADLLKFLARNPKTAAGEHQRILEAVAHKVTDARTEVFSHSEYERLGLVVLDIIRRGTLDEGALQTWVDNLVAVKQRQPDGYSAEYHAAYQNTKHFLRAVYFIHAYQNEEQPLEGAVTLQKLIFEALKQFRV
ncbi:MAG: DUF2785 domain-containing protein [bacterium]|nr:DUF2785 domain-containing protein [bacterium]